MDERDFQLWSREARRYYGRRRIFAIQSASFVNMEEVARDGLLMQLQDDIRPADEEQEAEWAANRAELRRFFGG